MRKIIFPLLVALSFMGCDNDDIIPEEVMKENATPQRPLNPQNQLDIYLDKNIAIPYGIEIVYRFQDKKFINREYPYTPTQYDKAIEFVNVFKYLFIEPYVKIKGQNFLKEYSSIKDFIKHFPHQHKYRGDLIGVPMKKYPYLVFYKVDDTKREIIIKDIFNTYQDTSKYPK